MPKRSQKHHVRYEHSSCMWGLISILDFRRSNRKLLPDNRRRSRRAVNESIQLPSNVNEFPEEASNSKEICDASKISVKTLIEEEMVNEDDVKLEYRKKSRRYSTESLNSECSYHKEDGDTENNHNLNDIMEEFRHRIYEKSSTNQASKAIVVLKPISNNLNSLSESSQAQSDHSQKASSRFSLAEIKRRWKNVMGKEQPSPTKREEGIQNGEKLGNKSSNPSKDRFYIEKITRLGREETIVKLSDADAMDSTNNSKRRVPNIYIEATKHLSEKLNSGIEETGSSSETLSTILAHSEFNSLVSSHQHDDSTPTPVESPPIIKKTQDLDRVTNEAAQTLQIKIKEEFSISCMNEDTFEAYIKTVLQACGSNWDELYLKSQISDQILDLSLFDQVSFGCCNHDTKKSQMLLFDCINEVLLEVCGGYLGSKKTTRPVPDMESGVSEVLKGVKRWYLTDPAPPTGTLDQIINNDISRSESWMDLQLHIEEISVDLADHILVDMIEDIASSSMDEIENDWSIGL